MFPVPFQTPSGGSEGKYGGRFGGLPLFLAQLCCGVFLAFPLKKKLKVVAKLKVPAPLFALNRVGRF